MCRSRRFPTDSLVCASNFQFRWHWLNQLNHSQWMFPYVSDGLETSTVNAGFNWFNINCFHMTFFFDFWWLSQFIKLYFLEGAFHGSPSKFSPEITTDFSEGDATHQLPQEVRARHGGKLKKMSPLNILKTLLKLANRNSWFTQL